jgi:hypothetical protein
VFREQGLDYTDEEIGQILKAKAPEKPSFPIFMLFLALLKDILDTLTLTGVGYILCLAVSLIIGGLIFIWLLFKGKAPWKKKRMQKSLQRFIAVCIADLIPGINIIPMETVFIIMIYLDEKKAAESLGDALGTLRNMKRFLRR